MGSNLDSVVQFHAIPRSHIPAAAGAAISIHHDDGYIDWLVDEDALDVRILHQLEVNGDAAASTLLPRDTPSDRRWGLLEVVREDISIEEMKGWRQTDAGLYFPVPRELITENLAAEIAAIGTDQLRFFDPK